MTTRITSKVEAPVNGAPARDSKLRRQCDRGHHLLAGSPCTVCGDGQSIMHRRSAGTRDGAVPLAVLAVLGDPGVPLAPSVQDFMARRLGRDFSAVPVRHADRSITIARDDDPREFYADHTAERVLKGPVLPGPLADLRQVRLHHDDLAAAAARSVGAQAFAVGHQVVFGAGQYRPDTADGRRLLAHELSHVGQGGSGAMLHRKALPGDAGGVAEPVSEAPEPDDENKARSSSPQGNSPAAPSTPQAAAAVGPNPSAPATPQTNSAALTTPPGVEPKALVEEPPQSVGDVPTGDLALIDEELAEHERWGAAAAKVGKVGSQERAGFIAESAGGGAVSGAGKGLVMGAVMSAGTKVAEKAVEKAAIAWAARVGAQALKFTPLPAVGAIVGGVMAGIDLAKRDWGETGRTIAGFGKGADVYEQLANSIEAISAVIEVASAVANVIAGVIGLIAVIAWAVAAATLGAASPIAVPLTTVAGLIGMGTMALDAINALVLKRMITLFRALHGFAADADPRDIVAQGKAIEGAAGATTGFVAGLAGAKVGEEGVHLAASKLAPKIPPHPTPPAATGEGPIVKAEPTAQKTTSEGPRPLAPSPAAEPAPGTATAAPSEPAAGVGTAAPEPPRPAAQAASVPEVPKELEINAVPAEPAGKPPGATGPPEPQAPAVEVLTGSGKGGAPPETPAAAAGPGLETQSGSPSPSAPTSEGASAPPTSAASASPEANVAPSAAAEPIPTESVATGGTAAANHEVAPTTPPQSTAQPARLGAGTEKPSTPQDPNRKLKGQMTWATLEQHSEFMEMGGDVELVKPEEVAKLNDSIETAQLAHEKRMKTEADDIAAGKKITPQRAQKTRQQRQDDLKALAQQRQKIDADRQAALQKFLQKQTGPTTVDFDNPNIEEWHPAGVAPDAPVTPVKPDVEFPLAEPIRKPYRKGAKPEVGLMSRYQRMPPHPGLEAEHVNPYKAMVAGSEIPRPPRKEDPIANLAPTLLIPERVADIKTNVGPNADQRRIARYKALAAAGKPVGFNTRLVEAVEQGQWAVDQAAIGATPAGPTTPAPTASSASPASTPSPAAPASAPSAAGAAAAPTVDTTLPTLPDPVSAPLEPKQLPPSTPAGASEVPIAEPPPPASTPAATQVSQVPEAAPVATQSGPMPPSAPAQPPAPATATSAPQPEAASPQPEPPAAQVPLTPVPMTSVTEQPVGSPNPPAAPTAQGAAAAGEQASVPPLNTPPAASAPPSAGQPQSAPQSLPGTQPVPGTLQAQGAIVERVKPNYQPPPGTPDDLVSLRNQVIDTLGMRAKAEEMTNKMATQEAHHAANEKPIAELQKGTEEAISATEAHQRAIANRDEANARKKAQEDEVHGTLEDYSSRAGRLVTLTGPLRGLASFTGLASHLPDEPDVVLRFKRGILKVNADSSRFLSQLDKMDEAVAAQKAQQSDRDKGIASDAATIKTTDQKAEHSGQEFEASKDSAEDFDEKNRQRKQDAADSRKSSTAAASRFDAQAKKTQAQAVSLAAAMQQWARGHRQARIDALEASRKRLEVLSYRVTEVHEK